MLHESLWKYLQKIETIGGRLLRCRLKFTKKVDIIVAYGQQAYKNIAKGNNL